MAALDISLYYSRAPTFKGLAAPASPNPSTCLNMYCYFCLSQINGVIDEHIKYASFEMDSSVWEVIHDEGEMKVYRREMEEDGMIVDPLKAVHSVKV